MDSWDRLRFKVLEGKAGCISGASRMRILFKGRYGVSMLFSVLLPFQKRRCLATGLRLNERVKNWSLGGRCC